MASMAAIRDMIRSEKEKQIEGIKDFFSASPLTF